MLSPVTLPHLPVRTLSKVKQKLLRSKTYYIFFWFVFRRIEPDHFAIDACLGITMLCLTVPACLVTAIHRGLMVG